MPSIRLRSITIDCADPYRLARFWGPLLGFVDHPDDPNHPDDPEALLVDPLGRHPDLLFVPVPEPKRGKNRVHLDLAPLTTRRDAGVEHALALGATMVDDRRQPDGTGWAVLADPEGNGIEVYADRPVSNWLGESGEIRMSTDPLDLQDLLRSAGGTAWTGFPEGGSVGHVHLQVGDTAEADRFYRDVLGLDIAARYPGASFYGSGGYHHQLAGNVWNSRRAGVRPQGMAGLDAVEIVVRSAADLAAITARVEGAGMESIKTTDGLTLHDPWGTAITLTT